MINTSIKNKIIDFIPVQLTASNGEVVLDTQQGNTFACTQSSDTTYTVNSQPGEKWALILKIQTASTPTFSEVTLKGDLDLSAGAINVITFINTGDGIRGYVL